MQLVQRERGCEDSTSSVETFTSACPCEHCHCTEKVGTSWTRGIKNQAYMRLERVRWRQQVHSRRWRWMGPSCQRATRRWLPAFSRSSKLPSAVSCLRWSSSCLSMAQQSAGQLQSYKVFKSANFFQYDFICHNVNLSDCQSRLIPVRRAWRVQR